MSPAVALPTWTNAPAGCAYPALLADSGALRALAGNRHKARWEVAGVHKQLGCLPSAQPDEAVVELPAPTVARTAR